MKEPLEELIKKIEQLYNGEKYEQVIELLTNETLEKYGSAILYSFRAMAHSKFERKRVSLNL